MKKIIFLSVILSLLYVLPVFAGDTSENIMKRAAGGDAEACYNLGVMYNSGNGVGQDYKKAVEWYEKAAAQGDSRAEYDLGIINIGGQLGSRNYEKAVKYFESAALKGHAVAMCKLGMMYYGGLGVSQDMVAAHAYLSVAAANGAAKAVKDRERSRKILSEDQLKQAQKKIDEITKKLEENKKLKK
ncbi:MAG TPA: tetratricopeptide repeat protein [Candidatus Wallbacteria bacterium]|nr:tetratricopeptide repeat protein [Candidatus Wallbacteria bacterium]